MPTPSADEASAINGKIAWAYGLITSNEDLVHQLRNLKSGLMDDLLTGRVRVTPLLEGARP